MFHEYLPYEEDGCRMRKVVGMLGVCWPERVPVWERGGDEQAARVGAAELAQQVGWVQYRVVVHASDELDLPAWVSISACSPTAPRSNHGPSARRDPRWRLLPAAGGRAPI